MLSQSINRSSLVFCNIEDLVNSLKDNVVRIKTGAIVFATFDDDLTHGQFGAFDGVI